MNRSPQNDDLRLKEIAANGLPIVGSTEPYAFLLDSAGDAQSNDDYSDGIQLSENCEGSPAGIWFIFFIFVQGIYLSVVKSLKPLDVLRHW